MVSRSMANLGERGGFQEASGEVSKVHAGVPAYKVKRNIIKSHGSLREKKRGFRTTERKGKREGCYGGPVQG